VPRDQLYKLAPPSPRKTRLGRLERVDRLRRLLRAWWMWLGLTIVLLQSGYWYIAIIAGIFSFVFYHTSPAYHAAIYAVEPDLDTTSLEFRETMAGMTGMPWVDGNRISIYNNGDEFYPAMLDAIESARYSITMEQYIFWPSEIGRRFAEAFADKSRRGVQVKLLVDAVGSSTLGSEVLKILEAGGCELAWFHPIHWYTLNLANHRTHRKSLIIDGTVAFTGGAGIADQWIGGARNPYEWRDIQICVEGPAALAQQSGFAENWLVTTGEVLSGPRFFPVARPAGNIQVQTILSSPHHGTGAAGTATAIALQSASRYIWIANPYFIPDFRYLEMLANAGRRGVSVKLLVAGKHSDTWWARQNSIRLYGKLFKAGVEIYEYLPTMLHQKVMIVDRAWASIGTSNFDNRSLALNEETNVCFHDRALIEELEAAFLADLARSEKIEAAAWRRRSLMQRVQEQVAALIEDQV
jgi:cardiolipin synthase